MYYKFIYIFLLFYLIPLSVVATTYENATDKKIDGWHVLKQFSKGVVKNIYDKKKKSRVIKLDGNETRSVYMLMPKKKGFKRKKNENILEWEMNYNEDFVIMIGVNTVKGKRFLIYTSGESDSYFQYGLGVESCSGKWVKYRRNLQKDLEQSDRYNKFLNMTSFVIKGSGMVDNIKIVQLKKSDEIKAKPPVIKASIKKNNIISRIVKKEENVTYNRSNESNTTPTIHLNGENPMVLNKGESYVEPGAIAQNRDGTSISVTISDDIDVFKEGEYSVIYMATNSAGNSVIDRRAVRVGNVVEEKITKESKDESEKEASEDLNEEAIDLEQRALEMLEWEKELAFREKELLEKKNAKEVTSQNENYPSRPGLE